MPALRTRLLAVLAVVAATALAGCAPADATPPTPTPTLEPVFASDEEALAAAIAAHEAHQNASSEISSEGGTEPERIAATVTDEYSALLIEEFVGLQERALRTEGTASFDSASLADYFASDDESEVSVYLCRDIGEVRVIDASGADVTPTARTERTPLLVHLVGSVDDPAILLISAIEPWSGDSFC